MDTLLTGTQNVCLMTSHSVHGSASTSHKPVNTIICGSVAWWAAPMQGEPLPTPAYQKCSHGAWPSKGPPCCMATSQAAQCCLDAPTNHTH
jgi:hypothetical protein